MSAVSIERAELESPEAGDSSVLLLLAALFFVSGACGWCTSSSGCAS